jgi:hypothetical protein
LGERIGAGASKRTAREEAVFGGDADGVEEEDGDWGGGMLVGMAKRVWPGEGVVP